MSEPRLPAVGAEIALVEQWMLQAQVLHQQGRAAAAVEVLQKAHDLAREFLPVDSSLRSTCAINLADFNMKLKNHAVAERIIREQLASLTQDSKEATFFRRECRSVLSNLYFRSGELDKSRSLLHEAVADFSAEDPYHPQLASTHHLLAVIFRLNQQEEEAQAHVLRMTEVRDRLSPAHPEFQEVQDLVSSALQDFWQMPQPEAPRRDGDNWTIELALARESECWSRFIRRSYVSAALLARQLLETPYASPRVLLIWIVSLRALDKHLPSLDEVPLRFADKQAWVSAAASFAAGRTPIEPALAVASENAACMTWFYGGMLALLSHDEALARARFGHASELGSEEITERGQALIEIDWLDHPAVAAESLSLDGCAVLEKVHRAFALHDYPAVVKSAKELQQLGSRTPEVLLLQVAALLALGNPDLAESVSAGARRQLIRFPWYLRLLDIVERKLQHPRLLPEAGEDATRRCQIHYYAMVQMQIAGQWQEASTLRNLALQVVVPCIEYKLAERENSDPHDRIDKLNTLSAYLGRRGDHESAECILRYALSLARNVPSAEGAGLTRSLLNLASLLGARGKRSESLVLFAEIETSGLELTSDEHLRLAANAGQIFLDIGASAEARRLLTKAAAAAASVPLEPDDMAALANALGRLELSCGAVSQAMSYFEQALAMQQQTGRDACIERAVMYDHLAQCHTLSGRHDEALSACQHAREDIRQGLNQVDGGIDPRHPSILQNLSNLTSALFHVGRYEEAEACAHECLEMARTAESTLSETVQGVLQTLASVCLATGRATEAFDHWLEAARHGDHVLGEMMSLGGEHLRMNYAPQAHLDMAFLVTLASRRFAADHARLERVLDVVFRRKGLAGDAAIVERAVVGNRYPRLQPALARLTKLRSDLATATLAAARSADPLPGAQGLAALRAQVRALETSLAANIPELQLSRHLREITARRVVSALGKGWSLVEIVRCAELKSGVLMPAPEQGPFEVRYWAFVIPQADLDHLALIDLGPADQMEQQVEAFLRAHVGCGQQRDFDPSVPADPDDEEATRCAHQLRETLFDPLEAVLPASGNLLLASDGAVARVPFEVLPHLEGGLLMDRYRISYIGTARDILWMARGPARSGPSVVAVDPDFDLGKVPGEDGAFGPLPGTRREGLAVAHMLGVDPWLGADVLEARLKGVSSPRVLHLATHGFYADMEPRDAALQAHALRSRSSALRLSPSDDPMLRSGLALAGANRSAHDLQSDPDTEDGLLTASEVLSLSLQETELVVLSACDTGLGKIAAGEGVMGLRRAFVLAGARSVVVSLWKVPDDLTCELMEGFYRRLLQGAGRIDALHQAQTELRVRHLSPRAWGAFICFGETGPLESLHALAEKYPSAGEDRLRRGISCHLNGQYAEAIAEFDAALSEGATTPVVLMRRGFALHRLGHYTEAMADFDRALALDDRYAAAYHRRGNLFAAMNNPEQALWNLTHAIQLDPVEGSTWYDRGLFHADAGDAEHALADLSRAIDMLPAFEEAYVNRATVYMQQGEWACAIDDLVVARDLDPGDALAHFNLGQVYAVLKRWDEAETCLAQAAKGGARVAGMVEAVRRQITDAKARRDDPSQE